MGQVPEYLIIGNGKMAKHFCYYLTQLAIPFATWARSVDSEANLKLKIKAATHVILLLKDNAIEPFIQQHPYLQHRILIHFSGCLNTSLAYSTHPLGSFSDTLYPLSFYEEMTFVTSSYQPNFNTLFPQLPNQVYTIDEDVKPLYHAMCVLSGNFTTLLWHKMFGVLEKHFHIPKEAAFPYLKHITHNLLNHTEDALTGPLARGDVQTIHSNLQALNNDPFQAVYQAFVSAVQPSLIHSKE